MPKPSDLSCLIQTAIHFPKFYTLFLFYVIENTGYTLSKSTLQTKVTRPQIVVFYTFEGLI